MIIKCFFLYFFQVTAFSAYCEKKFEIEPVEVTYSDGNSYIYPDLSAYNMEVPLSYINGAIGVSLEAEEVCYSYFICFSLFAC